MNDSFGKAAIICASLVIIVTCIASSLSLHDADTESQCGDKGGVIVKSARGWLCVKAEVLR